MAGLDAWHLWIIAGVALLIAEIFTPGFVLACFGIGGLAAGLAAALGLGLGLQIALFTAASLAIFFGLRPAYLKHMAAGPDLKTNSEALVGKRGRVIEAIVPLERRGRVQIGGEEWSAVSDDDEDIEEGATILVLGVDGSRVIVALDPLTSEV